MFLAFLVQEGLYISLTIRTLSLNTWLRFRRDKIPLNMRQNREL